MNNLRFEALELAAQQVQEASYDALTQAIVKAESRAYGLPHYEFPSIRPFLARCDFRQLVDVSSIDGNWRLGSDSTRNAQIHLVNDHVELKLLKERSRDYPGGVPPAGRNRSRQRYYGDRQDALDLGIPGQDRIRALLLWDYSDPGDRQAGIKIRIVETAGPGSFGRAVPLATTIPLAAGGLLDLSTISFEGDDEPVDFFTAEISKEDNEQASGS